MIYHRICNTDATSGADITLNPVINHVRRRGCNYYKGNICSTSGTRITNPVINYVRRRGCNYYKGNICSTSGNTGATSGADITIVVVTTRLLT
jgi:ribosomal protein L35AE/L33A